MAYSSAIPRQLAPTMGQEALQALQRARTKIFAGIGETIAIGRVLFAGIQNSSGGTIGMLPEKITWLMDTFSPIPAKILVLAR